MNLHRRLRLAAWVATEIMPHESDVRKWLMRSGLQHHDVDELIQDAYCRIAMLKATDHIDRPGAYFFSIARNLLLRRMKRARIVPLFTIAEIESSVIDEFPSPERQVAAKLDYDRLMAILAELPERRRRIVMLRKIDGLSQKDIADFIGVTEAVVEKEVWMGVRAIQSAWKTYDVEIPSKINVLN